MESNALKQIIFLDCIISLFRVYIYTNCRIHFEFNTKEAHTFNDLRNTSYLIAYCLLQIGFAKF